MLLINASSSSVHVRVCTVCMYASLSECVLIVMVCVQVGERVCVGIRNGTLRFVGSVKFSRGYETPSHTCTC